MRILFTVAAAIALALVQTRLEAQPVEMDCFGLASGIALMADFRDTGAKLEKVLKLVPQRSGDLSPAQQEVVARELRRLWRERLPRAAAADAVFKRCMAQLGEMGRDG